MRVCLADLNLNSLIHSVGSYQRGWRDLKDGTGLNTIAAKTFELYKRLSLDTII